VSIQDAARRLGVSEGAVRKRVARGTLHHDKADDGRVYVFLDAGVDAGQDAGVDANNNALISQLRSENQYLREENQRKDEIIMQQAMTMRQLTAPAEEERQEAPESPRGPVLVMPLPTEAKCLRAPRTSSRGAAPSPRVQARRQAGSLRRPQSARRSARGGFGGSSGSSELSERPW
jgi:hypothetical protein